MFEGSYDNNTNIHVEIEDLMTQIERNPEIINDSFTISNPGLEELFVELENEYATAVIYNSQSQAVVSTEYGYLYYMFTVEGTYTIVVTAVDGTQKTYTIIVEEVLPAVEIEIEWGEAENSEDNLVFTQTLGERGLEGDFVTDEMGTSFNAYIENVDVSDIPDNIVINRVSSAVFKNDAIKFYKNYEDGELSNEIDVTESFTLVVNKELTNPTAFIYVKVPTGAETFNVTVMSFIFGENLGELIFNITYGEKTLSEYVNMAEESFSGDLGFDIESVAFVGFLGLDDYDQETITLDSIQLPFIDVFGLNTFYVVDFVSYINARGDESLTRQITVDGSRNASNVELEIYDAGSGAYCGFLIIFGEAMVGVVLMLGSETIDLFTVEANGSELNVSQTFNYDMNDFVINGMPYYMIYGDYGFAYEMHGYLGDVEQSNIEVVGEDKYLLNVKFTIGDIEIFDANNDNSEITDLSNFKLKVLEDDNGQEYVCILMEDGSLIYLYFTSHSYPVHIELGENNFDWNFEYSEDKGLLYDFGDFNIDYAYLINYGYSFMYAYIDENSIVFDEEFLEFGYNVALANITLDKLYEDYSYMVMVSGAYDEWASGEITLEELFVAGRAFRVDDVNNLTMQVPVLFEEGLGYVDIAVEGFDGENDGELDLVRVYFIINGVGNKDDIEYGTESDIIGSVIDLSNEVFTFTLTDGTNIDTVTSESAVYNYDLGALVVYTTLRLEDISNYTQEEYITFVAFTYSGNYELYVSSYNNPDVYHELTEQNKNAVVLNYNELGLAAEICAFDDLYYAYRILIVFADSVPSNPQ